MVPREGLVGSFVVPQQFCESRILFDSIQIVIFADASEVAIAQFDSSPQGLQRLIRAFQQSVTARQTIVGQSVFRPQSHDLFVNFENFSESALEGEKIAEDTENINVFRRMLQNPGEKLNLEVDLVQVVVTPKALARCRRSGAFVEVLA
jgi:hypothetical protein